MIAPTESSAAVGETVPLEEKILRMILTDACPDLKGDAFAIALKLGRRAAEATVRRVLHDACEPWSFSTGNPPDDDSPLTGVFCAGMAYTEALLAKRLGVTSYEGGDGSEDFDNDATMTLLNILAAAGMYDRDEGQFAALTAHPSVAAGDGGDWSDLSPADIVRRTRCEADSKLSHIDAATWRSCCDTILRRIGDQRPAPAQAPETAGGDLAETFPQGAGTGTYFRRLPGNTWVMLNHADQWVTIAAPTWENATPSAAPGGSDRERVARAAARRVIFGIADGPDVPWHPDQDVIVRAGRVESEMLALLTPQPASPGAVERVTGDEIVKLIAKHWLTAKGASEEDADDLSDLGELAHISPEDYAACVEVARAILHRLATPPTGPDAAGAAGEGWRPIETAPRDATVQIVVVPRGDPKTYSVPTAPTTFPAYIDEHGQICCPGSWKPDLGLNGPGWRAILWHPMAKPPALAALPAASGAGEDADAGVGS